MWLFAACIPLLVGAAVAGAGHGRYGAAPLVIGFGWYIVGATWWGRRVRRIRAAESVTTRDVVEIEYPRWSRSLASGYLAVLAGMTGVLILGAVIFVVVAVATK